MFKARAPAPRFRKKRVAYADDEALPASSASQKTRSLLSFDDDDQDALEAFREKKKKKSARPAPVSEPVASTSDRCYDAASLAELKAQQQAPPADAALEAEEDDTEEAAAARMARAVRRNVDEADVVVDDEAAVSEDDGSEAPDFVAIGPRAHDGWVPTNAADDIVDDDDALFRGAARIGESADDNDDELAQWENEVVARGSAASAQASNPNAPQSTRPDARPGPAKARPNLDHSLDRALAHAAEETARAERALAARRAQLADHDAALARATADVAHAEASLASLRAARDALRVAIDAAAAHGQTDDLRLAMATAVGLAEAAEDSLDLGVYYQPDRSDDDETPSAS